MNSLKCPKCDKEILIVPDARAMGKAIVEHCHVDHANLYTKSQMDLEEDLIAQLIRKVVQYWETKEKS